jgi:hypothetical protein
MSVEGISKSAIPRIEHQDWNTVNRWLELAATLARKYNNTKTRGYDLEELELDELSTFLGNRNQKKLGLRRRRSLIPSIASNARWFSPLQQHQNLRQEYRRQ